MLGAGVGVRGWALPGPGTALLSAWSLERQPGSWAERIRIGLDIIILLSLSSIYICYLTVSERRALAL